MKDKFGGKLSNTVYYISNVLNQGERVRCGLNEKTPDGYEKIISSEYIVNPNYNSNITYFPRGDRKEWKTIGLIGKLRIFPDQVINPNWKLLRTLNQIDGNTMEYLVK